MSRWDAVVIGSGIGGLCCAGTLAARGRKVIVLEQGAAPGGYLTSFRRGEFVFDSAVDCFAGLDRDGLLAWVLRSLGVEGELASVRIDPIRVSRYPGLTVRVDADLPTYIERLTALFPSEGKGIASFFRRCHEIYSDVDAAMAEVRDERGTGAVLPASLLRHRESTYGELLRQHIRDGRLMAVLSDRCPFLGLPPGKVSAVRMVSLVMSYFRSGAFRTIGGHQRLSSLLAHGIRRNGGEVLLSKGAARIVAEGRRCVSVVADDGEDFPARHVVSNAGFHETFSRLVGGDAGARVVDAAAGRKLSPSFFIVYAGVRGDLPMAEGAGSIGAFDGFDLDLLFRRHVPFFGGSTVGITVPTIDDPSLAPPGHHAMLIHELIPAGYAADWKAGKEEFARLVLKKAEGVIPGLAERIVRCDAATPATLARYTRNRGGAAFGWEQVPVLEPARHGMDNLHLAGHWTETGGRVLAAAFSGVRAASRILRATS